MRSAANAFIAVTAIRNLEKDNWLEQLEIEVKNISERPVYYVSLVLRFPGLVNRDLDGLPRVVVIPLSYGRAALLKHGSSASEDDIPIRPGQTHIFKVPERLRSGLQGRINLGLVPSEALTRIAILIETVSFGDGSRVDH